ncbi:MAG: PSD1 and planctomycete cytochrome C domain-containing protein [Rubripirellula sp.]
MMPYPPSLTCRRWLIAVGILAVAFRSVQAVEPIDFERDIEPILQAHCIRCHGSEDTNSGLRLDQRNSMLRGGDQGQATIVPGKPSESFLLDVLSPESEMVMPPEGEPLESTQIELIRRWIKEGAEWPGQMHLTADLVSSDHWSLQPIHDMGAAPHDASNAIDGFVDARLAKSGLQRSPPADAVTQLRRLSLVLTGLPPAPNEVERLLHHPKGLDAAYREAVDRLLDSPRYGERWAQHWLDVIRWAETVGFETNLARSRAWPYRDWVIDSLNEDKPYDQFVFEQLAGDTVGEDAALGFLVAGPANLPAQVGRDEEAMRQSRQDELDEVIRTVSQGLFGLTIGCARCHNHKFDPILQRDYYAMQAVFAGLSYGERRLRGDENDRWTAQRPEAERKRDVLIKQRDTLRGRLKLRPSVDLVHTESFPPVQAAAIRMSITHTHNGSAASLYELEAWTTDDLESPTRNVALASSGASPSASNFALANQTRHFDNLVDGSVDRRQAFPWVAETPGTAWVQIEFPAPVLIDRIRWHHGSSIPVEFSLEVRPSDESGWVQVTDSSDRMPREDDARNADQIQLQGIANEDVTEIVQLTRALRAARREVQRLAAGPRVFAAQFTSTPEPTWQLRRGDPMQRLEQIEPAIPKVLGDLRLEHDEPEPTRRVALAKHLTEDDHPLTSRVIVNRLWHHHFGNGLVDTPSDFGTMGSQPTHPELLDWLAHQFVRDDWSLKRLHRRIVLSATFRQSSRPQRKAIAIDSESRLLWRFPPRRMEAEAIRDSILQASGKLNLKTGGPGFDLFQQRGGLSGYDAIETFEEAGWRRMIYAHKIRMQSVDIFGAFDCPDAGQMKPKRTQSITPTQSLSLLNSPFINRQAEHFAERIVSETSTSVDAQTRRAFEIALSRPPSDIEQEKASELVERFGLSQLCRVLFNTSEFLYIP